MNVFEITRKQALRWVKLYPELVKKAFSGKPSFKDLNARYIALTTSDDIGAVIKYEKFSDYCINLHAYMNPKYWKTEFFKEASNKLDSLFKSIGAKSLVCMVPEPCIYVLKACNKAGFKQKGLFEKATEWKGQTVDLLMFQKELH